MPDCSIEMHGASEVIKWLHQHGYFIGVISNGVYDSRKRTLAATTLHPYISQLVSSEISCKKKPNRDIFIDTTRSQGFAPSECVYIGDHPINDALGSLNVGMHSVLLRGFHPAENLPEKIIQIDSLLDESWFNLLLQSHGLLAKQARK